MFKRFASIFSLIVLVLVVPISLVGKLRSVAIQVLRPIASPLIQKNVQLVDTFRTIRQIPQLRAQTQDLQQQNLSLEQKFIEYENLARENQVLRTELGVTGISRSYKKVFARVVVRGTDSEDQTFTVDVGTSNSVKIGQPAVYHGALIGKIIIVYPNSAVVRTIVSRESRIQAWISDTHEKGLLIGNGSTTYLSDITQGVNVGMHSVVETSGLGGSLPAGIVIGQVRSAESQKSDLSQKFSVTLDQDPVSLESAFILLTDTQ